MPSFSLNFSRKIQVYHGRCKKNAEIGNQLGKNREKASVARIQWDWRVRAFENIVGHREGWEP